ncbi:MAG: regulatory protein TetR [Rhodospirillales bacterium]|nr:regulatory protein TetR [Rhodospirillales bacterium]
MTQTRPKETASPDRRGGSRDAIVRAAERLFLERGFGAVSMDDLASEAGVARRTLYNQFTSKEEILREMLRGLSEQLRDALPPGIETQGEVEEVLRRIGKGVLTFQAPASFVGLVRMTAADAQQFPWIAAGFDAVLDPQLKRFARYLAHLTTLGVLACPDPLLAAHQFLGLLNEPVLWPRVLRREQPPVTADAVVDEAVQMFLCRYRVSDQRKVTRGGKRSSK